MPVLAIDDLKIGFSTPDGPVEAVRGVSLTIDRGECRHYGQAVISDDHNPDSLTCSDCGEEINPYEFIRRIAHREVNFCFTRNALREEANELAAEVKRLKARRSDLRRKERQQ